MVVRRLQRGDIALARLAGVDETLPPPGKPGLAEAHEQEVRRQARMPAVAVGETMNLKTVVTRLQLHDFREVDALEGGGCPRGYA
jgi:hypothetical protein